MSSSTGRRRHLSLAIAAVLAGAVPAAGRAGAAAPASGSESLDFVSALELPTGGGNAADDQAVYLEVFVRGEPTGLIAQLRSRGGRLYATAQELAELGVRVPDAQPRGDDGTIALDALPGLDFTYDVAQQRLLLVVPVSLRPGQALGYRVPDVVRATRGSGVVLNYDAYGRVLEAQRSLAVGTSLRWFGRFGTLETTGVSRIDQDARKAYQRVDTRWSYSDPVRMLGWSAGDVITGALAWTRPVRLGGVQLRRNFAVRPDLITYPVPRFSGQATVPSTVELLVNNVEQFGAQVNDGPFVLDAFPRISGAGQATLVVRDALGRATETTVPLYVDAQRLAPGLSDFSVELGTLRTGFGGGTDDYGDALLASGSWRRGLTDAVTLEAHAEAGDGVRMAGAGIVWSPAHRWGLVTASFAHGRHGDARGNQVSLGYQWLGPRFGLDVWAQRADAGFADLGVLGRDPLSSTQPVTEQQRASFWLPLPRGSVSLTALRLRRADGESDALRTLSWSHTLPRNVSLSANAFDSDDSGPGVGVSISLPVGGLDATVSVDHADGRTDAIAAVRRTPAYEGGWGWEVQGGDRGGAVAQASASVRGRLGDAWVGVDHAPGTTGAFAQAAGSIAWMGGHAFVGRRIGDAFAVVSSNGVPGVPVLLQNRAFGRTDARGLLLVPDLLGWQHNKLGIDPDALGADYRIPRIEQDVVPADGGGVLARFAVTRLHPAMVRLLDPRGAAAPAGGQGIIEGGDETFLVGYDGEAYVENALPGAILRLPVGGQACRYRLPAATQADASNPPVLGPLPCEVTTP